MSIKVMSQVWDIEGIDSSECLVLIALADHADDQGRCYPSIGRLAKRTKLSDRGVQKVISRLIEKGFVSVSPCAGQGGSNLYTVTATPSVPTAVAASLTPPKDLDAQLRWRVYKRDSYSCRYCGFQGHEDGHNLTVDHIVPVSKGGSNAESNLNTCCFSCNSSKKNKDLDAWIEQRGVNDVHPEPRSPRTSFTTPPNDVRETPEPRSPKPSRTTIEPSEGVGGRAHSFDAFWASWPLAKTGKDAAKRAWGKLSPAQRRLATERSVDWCGSWVRANPRLNHIHPSTYLNNKRWEDEAQPALTIIPGGPHEQSPQHNRQLSRADATSLGFDVVARTRRASSENLF